MFSIAKSGWPKDLHIEGLVADGISFCSGEARGGIARVVVESHVARVAHKISQECVGVDMVHAEPVGNCSHLFVRVWPFVWRWCTGGCS